MVGRLSERRMSAKVDQTSPVAKISSAVSASGPKISMFAAKSGFVIPKNKLSGSLVPVFRGGKKAGGSDAATEESTNQVQRKTKWAPDLTQDAAVRRGRALAYQTRLDQITQQLKCGTLEVGQKQDSPSAALDANEKSSNSQVDNENLELLELERREAIGEILKFNPSYKAPPDYKPLMKEARVAIPVKDYPGFNFLGLIFGPGGETQKRLEKETGAKIQVYGTKEKLGEKVEISPPDGNEIQSAFEELYVNISAQTFEKVDAAVALMELLVTSVSGNLGAASTSTAVSGKNVIVPGKTQEAAIDQGMAQQMVGSMQTPMQDQFQYHGTWLHAGPHQSLVHPPLNSSVPILSNPVLNQSSPINSPNMPSLFGPLPASVPPSSQPLMQVLPPSYVPQTPPLGHAAPPRNFPMPVAPQPSSVQSGLPGPLPFIGSQPQSTGPIPPVRPLMPLFPHTVSSVPRPDQLLTPVGSSTGWSGASAGPPVSLGPSNIGQLPPPVVPPLGNRPVVLQPENSSSALPSSTLATNVVSPATLPSGVSNPLLSGAPVNRSAAPVFPCGPAPRVGHSPIQSSSLHATAVSFRGPTPNVGQPSPNPSMNPITVSNPIHSTSQPAPPHTSISNSIFGSLANFTPIIPAPSVGPKPLHPSSSDFTFQLQQSQNPAPQPTSPNILPSRPMVRPMVQPLVPQAPSLPVGVPNSTLQPIMQVFPRPQTHLSSAPFASNPTAISAPPRFPAFQNVGPPAVGTPLSQVRPMNFGPPRQMQNIAATFSRRPEYQMQPLQNYPFRNAQPQNSVPSNQRFNNNLPPASGKLASSHFSRQQIYDPFSPSSVSVVPNQLRGDMPNVRKQEIDPEYEDLMASVGMK